MTPVTKFNTDIPVNLENLLTSLTQRGQIFACLRMQKILGISEFAVYIFRPTTDLRIHVEHPELFSNKKEREKILRIP